MTKRMIAACAVLALVVLSSGSAMADSFRVSFGSGGCGYGGYPSYGRSAYSSGYGYGGYGHGFSSYNLHSHRTWHDTSHYDYHPPTAYRHRNHYHVVPGHYDLHRTGHWDTYHH